MAESKCQIRVGTSGWYYNHWRERFYPAEMSKYKWFEYYTQHFDTVEINNTFYQLPKEQNLKRWYKLSPKGFIYAVKANRAITHLKKLKKPVEELKRFEQSITVLKEKLGPILYQLPPNLHKNLDLLQDFLQLLSKDEPSVFEFRHESWFEKECYNLLEEFGKSFCIHDMPGVVSPRVVTGKIIYVRFHGPGSRYEGKYTKQAIKEWAKWIGEHLGRLEGVYAYFNNDAEAYAVYNAKELKEELLR